MTKILNLLAAIVLIATGCSKKAERVVVVYTSQDQVFAEPIFAEFTKATGITVKPLFDNESVKTAGLAKRLYLERDNPQCDVFWNNEEMHTRALARNLVFESTNGFRSFGYRSRRIVINTNLVKISDAPKSLLELTNVSWKGKVALANPMFGTTASHFIALRQFWGDKIWKSWCQGLIANGAKVVDGNSMVVRLVGHGEAAIGMTDFDDIAAGKREGLPVEALPFNDESLLIPNTVAITRNAPHLSEAEELMKYLTNTATVKKLVEARALEGVEPPKEGPRSIAMNWSNIEQGDTTIFLSKTFLQ